MYAGSLSSRRFNRVIFQLYQTSRPIILAFAYVVIFVSLGTVRKVEAQHAVATQINPGHIQRLEGRKGETVTCGVVDSKWLVGSVKSSAVFISYAEEIDALIKRIKNLSAPRRTALLLKIKKIRAKNEKYASDCASLTAGTPESAGLGNSDKHHQFGLECTGISWNDYEPWIPDYKRYRHCNPMRITRNNEIVAGCKFAPCYGGTSCVAITIEEGVTGVQILDNLFQGYYGGSGVQALGGNAGLYIHRNFFVENFGRAVSINNTSQVAVQNNRFYNQRGFGYEASAVLVTNSTGAIDISWNRVLLKPSNVAGGGSWTNDVFSIYESGGTSSNQRLTIQGNMIVGGHSGMEHGDGIVVGDGCNKGNYVLVKNNRLINSGLAGITGSGGYDYVFEGNIIYSCPGLGREEWGAYRAGQQHAWVPPDCQKTPVCDNLRWISNQAHVRSIGTFGRRWNELLNFGTGSGAPGQFVSCKNIIERSNNWQNTLLTGNFIAKDFMNACTQSIHCPAGYQCANGKCL